MTLSGPAGDTVTPPASDVPEESMTQKVQSSQSAPLVMKEPLRPGLITFTAVMMWVLSGFYVIAAITEWANSSWLYQQNFSVGGSRLVVWGFIDFGIAVLSVYGGYLLLVGHRAGQVLAFAFVGVSFMRWMFYIPADPWLALAILAVDAMMIYGLSAHDDWFASRQT
jgi:hypothetical protein